MAKSFKVITAAITGIVTVGGSVAYTGSSSYMDGEIGNHPLVVDLDEAFYANDGLAPQANHEINISMIQFTCDVNTKELPDYKAFCTQGMLTYEDKNSEWSTRTFNDTVSVDNSAYPSVAGKNSVQTVYQIGSKSTPLNMWVDDDNTMTLEFTWCTATSLKLSDMIFIDDKGNQYNMPGTIYAVSIEDDNCGNGSVTTTANTSNAKCRFPFADGTDFCVSSTQWEYRGGNEYHGGMDLCSQGSYDIYATVGGYVEYADWENPYDWSQGFGQYVKVVGDDGYWYYYGHMSELYVAPGDRVEAGQKIGYEGSTGSSTGDHLHFEVRDTSGCQLDASEFLGIPNEYGMVYASDYMPAENVTPSATSSGGTGTGSSDNSKNSVSSDLIQRCISFNKHFEVGADGLANVMNLDDSGAVSIGIIQCRGELARELVEEIRDANPSAYAAIESKYNWSGTDFDWSDFTISEGSDDYNFLTELLIQDWAVDAQWNFVSNYMSRAISRAQDAGITDEDNILIYTRCYVNAGPNSNAVYFIEDNPNASTDTIFNNISITHVDKVHTVFDENSWNVISVDDVKA